MQAPLARNPNLSVQPSPVHGLGVFALSDIESGSVLEECPVLLIDEQRCEQPDGKNLSSYLFRWAPDSEALAIVLGSGCLYNHSPKPNAKYEKCFADRIVRFTASRSIRAGEEIFLDFLQDRPGGDLWFEVKSL